MKIESLIAKITAIGSPVGAESAVILVILASYGKFGPLLWPESHFVIWRHLLEP